jgi:hypothetical protein
VIDHAGPDLGDATAAAATAATLRRATRLRRLPVLVRPPRASSPPAGDLGRHLERVARLYAAVRDVSGCRVVVDSSKLPAYARVLRALPGVDLVVVHLVRDPRAAAYSWARVKHQPDGHAAAYMQRQSVLKSSLLWDVWNLSAPHLAGRRSGRYAVVRYEDLVARPREVVTELVTMAGDRDDVPTFVDDRTVVLGVSHTVAGNPDRLRTGPVEIRADDEWRRRASRRQLALATAATAPVLGRFGYPLRVGEPSPPPPVPAPAGPESATASRPS